MAINRNRDRHGLKAHIAEDTTVATWYGRVLALCLLPQYLIPLSGVLQVPVSLINPAYRNCAAFLAYFSKNWMQGLYAGKWHQFNIYSHRSTNATEGYHCRLLSEFPGTDFPDLTGLLNVFKAIKSKYTTH